MDFDRLKNFLNTTPNFSVRNNLCFTVVEEGYCECVVDMTQWSLNPQGVAHGSLLFTLCDVATGVAAATTAGGRGMLTQSASIHYLRPASSGRLTAKSRMIRDGNTLAVVGAEVFDEQGRLLVTGEFSVWYTGDFPLMKEEGS